MKNISLSKKRAVLAIGILSLFVFSFTFFVYTPALNNDFVNWDDDEYVYKNTRIQYLDPQSLCWMLTSFNAANWHPLTWLSHAIDYSLWGLNPRMHHLTNVILHALNTLLVFFLALQIVNRWKTIPAGMSSGEKNRVSLTEILITGIVTALLFGVHPLNVESVAWISERKNVLSTLFFLLSLLSYISYASSILKRHRLIWFALSFLFFLLALMSKPIAVTLPLILLLLDYYPLNRLSPHYYKNLQVFLEKVPFFLLSIATSVITVMAQQSGRAFISVAHLPIGSRLLNALHSLIFYLKKMALPQELFPLYAFPKEISLVNPQYMVSGILILIITLSCFYMEKRGKHLYLIIWLYYVVTLIPVLGIVQVGGQASADRYSYIPSIGPFFLVGIGIAWIWRRIMLQRGKKIPGVIILAGTSIVISLLSYKTFNQIKIWKNSEVLWSYVIKTSLQKIPIAYVNLGRAFFDKGMINDAIAEYQKALTINPNLSGAYNNLGNAFSIKGMLDEAIAAYKRALVLDPYFVKAHSNLGGVYAKKGMLDEAIAQCMQAIAIDSNYAEAYGNLGASYLKKGMANEAIAMYEKVLSFKRNDPKAHENIGVAYGMKGRLDEAIVEFKRSLAINPNSPVTHKNLGAAYRKKGRLDEAIAEYRKALILNPYFAEAYNDLGNVYIEKNMLDRAISTYKQALEIKPDYADAYYNLGNAYYHKGDYTSAVAYFDKAKELGKHVNPQLLELFKHHQ